MNAVEPLRTRFSCITLYMAETSEQVVEKWRREEKWINENLPVFSVNEAMYGSRKSAPAVFSRPVLFRVKIRSDAAANAEA